MIWLKRLAVELILRIQGTPVGVLSEALICEDTGLA